MQSIKSTIGRIPSAIATRRLQRAEPAARGRWLQFVNERPAWFREVPRRLKVETRFGFPIWCDRWDVIGQAIIQTGQWEGLLSRSIQACLEPGDLAIDIGANIGYDTMLMSQAVGAKGQVLAFEPDLGNLESLLRNLSLAEHRNVAVSSLALSDAMAVAEIAVAAEGNRGQSNLRPAAGGSQKQPVLATRLDGLLSGLPQRRIGLVKIDVEGYEQKVIDGMGRMLDLVDVLICEVDPDYLKACGADARVLFETMWNAGFSSYCAQPNSNDRWFPAGPDFRIEVKHSQHFDAMFCRELPNAELRSLIGGESNSGFRPSSGDAAVSGETR